MLSRWLTVVAFTAFAAGSYYDEAEAQWNLNANKNAATPLDYDIPQWPPGFKHHESPTNWRFPFYSFFLDRFVNGDPTNDNANGTAWEHDMHQTQLRHGGDIRGLSDSLDYLKGLGIRGLYIAGSAMMNLPWEADGYSPLDHTILDHHFGNVQEWREAIQAIHEKGMYVILDNTMSTMSNLFGFEGYFNSSAPWSFTEHNMEYISDAVYRDYKHSNNFEEKCRYPYPRFWDQGGRLIHDENTAEMIGCMDSEFDQFGDVGAFGVYPEWQKQLSKFSGVQDRLREWRPEVLEKINHFSCMMIRGLDIDGFRIDKAMQVTVDAQGNFSAYQRDCAKKVGKTNFFIPGEIVNGNANGAIYLGRGKEPSMRKSNFNDAIVRPKSVNNSDYIRAEGHQALDASAFHYSTYRALMRFLGLDGNLLASNDASVNFQEQWKTFVLTNDMANAYTGEFDPRHMYGVSNQDVLRWPGLTNGTQRQLLGDFIVTLVMPGIPLVSWGEEQAFYTLDSTAANYVYGRQAMSSSQAWQMHGCYKVGDANLYNAPFNSTLTACEDDSVSLDHRDPSHPVYGTLKQMFELRQRYPVLQDGWNLLELSSQVSNYTLPGSFGVATINGLWSVVRSRVEGVQDFTGQGLFENQPVWLLYSNYNGSRTYESTCMSSNATISPFDAQTTVKNLFYPFDEWKLESSSVSLGIEGSSGPNGCLPKINMTMYGWKAFVPIKNWIAPSPVITSFSPGHDARILSMNSSDTPASIDIALKFSQPMDCDSIKTGVTVNSTTNNGQQASIDAQSITCQSIDPHAEAYYYGPSPSVWQVYVKLVNVYHGVHVVNVNNITSSSGSSTGSNDHFLVRVGSLENPIVFPRTANYSTSLLYKDNGAQSKSKKRDGAPSGPGFLIDHKAPGADKWRFSLSFGDSWSPWYDYKPGRVPLPEYPSQASSPTWRGDHVKVQYWSAAVGSSDHVVEGDLVGQTTPPRRVPHVHVHGKFNNFGYDAGLPNTMSQMNNGTWKFDFLTEWPSNFQLNIWGMAADGRPDVRFALGDVDNDTVLDRISPVSLQEAVVNITGFGPPSPALSWRILFDDGTYKYYLVPSGSRYFQAALWILLALIPFVTAAGAVWGYMHFFYGVKFNQVGLTEKKSILPRLAISKALSREKFSESSPNTPATSAPPSPTLPSTDMITQDTFEGAPTFEGKRRTVLIATMEYDIADWQIKVKIGGLGVMAQLMGKNLEHQDLIWVVPCAGGIEYPYDTPGDPIDVTILGKTYEVQVQYHKLNNITYMLVDAPVFRRQSAKEPYPARMDDLDSAIYYSAWNQCIAEAMNRFDIDLYHINDYHGTVAPLYHLPRTVPCCLSLHNAEFQGLWPMRNPQEVEEICAVFNLSRPVVQRYVQFGEVFNLLHAGASILRIHQKGFGAVGVSKKYGKRSWARYPIFWGLKKIGALPNPDPSDIAAWDGSAAKVDDVKINPVTESERAILKRQAQNWAGLEQRADADLFVFVGRWSMQKGIDLIADVFPAILEQHSHTQLLCVGPTIDLHGKFAALKLAKMMEKYPGRVYSKPEFTSLPPFIFSGAEFALIPSRDEPFGLVAVEFGRKGALGVGSRVGGLGQMPGWWYTIESSTTKHHMHQFKMAIAGALKSNYETRALMRARSARQRFPVVQWKEDLEILQSSCIKIHRKRMEYISNKQMGLERTKTSASIASGKNTPILGWMTPGGSRSNTRSNSPTRSEGGSRQNSVAGVLSLGFRHGPGHSPPSTAQSTYSIPTSKSSTERRSSLEDGSSVPPHVTRLDDEEYISLEAVEESKRRSQLESSMNSIGVMPPLPRVLTPGTPGSPTSNPFDTPIATPDGATTPMSQQFPFLSQPHTPSRHNSCSTIATSPLSTEHVRQEKKDRRNQNLTPFFTDPTGLYYKAFEQRLEKLNAKNSETALCIEEYLEQSEKQWFRRLHDARMNRSPLVGQPQNSTPAPSIFEGVETVETVDQFLLPENHEPPTGMRRFASYKIGDWPVYSFFLALGQILAANSYQITLISGQVGQTATQLYIVATVYCITTLLWWYIFRRLASVWCLSLPWLFYGLAFLLVALAPFGPTTYARGAVQMAATASYAAASSSGSLFFAQNFGSLGSVAIKDWAFRACAIQGTQQLYVVGLWAWGAKLAAMDAAGSRTSLGTTMTAIGIPIAIFLWGVGFIVFFGLPEFYRQKPGAVPDFYPSIFRRKIIVWFLITVFIQNIFLSAPYGRNWSYLWSSKYAPGWAIFLLVIFFFVFVWAGILWAFGHLSSTHSWILPIFAIGLGAPRWCQILWATSNIGQYLPWAGGPVASALLGRSLWLWLGLLDSIQGIGFGMILLQTMV